MLYYLLRTVSDPKIIGVKNGVTQVEIIEKEYSDKDQYKKMMNFFGYSSYWSRSSHFPDHNYEIEYACLLKDAILTDFLMFSPALMGCPFMISYKVKEVLDRFNLQEHYYLAAKIFNNKSLVSDKYWLLYCPYLDYDVIDFNHSTFFTGSALLGKRFHAFRNKQDFLLFQKSNPLMRGEKIVLNDSFNTNLDFFNPRFGGIYVSERLKNEIVKEGFSGIKILNSNEPEVVVG